MNQNKISPNYLSQIVEAVLNDEQTLNEERKNPDANKKVFDKKSKDLHALRMICYSLLDGMEAV
jgi:hypothetical protein